MRCPNKSGDYQCEKPAGHHNIVDGVRIETECEAEGKRGGVVAVDFDAQRELRRAAARIAQLEKALGEIRTVLALVAAGAPWGLALEDIRKVVAEVAHD